MKLIDKYNYYKNIQHTKEFYDLIKKYSKTLNIYLSDFPLDKSSAEFIKIKDFLLIYYYLDNNNSVDPWLVTGGIPPFQSTFQPNQNIPSRYSPDSSKDELSFYQVIDMLKEIINDYKKSKNVIHKIEYEYFNSHTKKRGLMLENGLMVEDNKIINKKIDNTLLNLIEYQIKWILHPDKRKSMEREKKLNRIL